MTDDGHLRVNETDPKLFGESHRLIESTEHLVFQDHSPLLMPEARAWYLMGDVAMAFTKSSGTGGLGRKFQVVQDRSTGNTFMPKRVPPRNPYAPWVPTGEMVDYDVPVRVRPEIDPIVSFYAAAAELKDRIAEEGRKLALDISAQGGPSKPLMITVVHSPIIATQGDSSGQFRLWTQLSQFAAESGAVANRDEALSTKGEVPFEAPSEITMKMLIYAEEELVKMGVIDPKRNVLDEEAIKEAARRVRRKDRRVLQDG
jgi:hypothetical protein